MLTEHIFFLNSISILVFLLVLEILLKDDFDCTRQQILYFCTWIIHCHNTIIRFMAFASAKLSLQMRIMTGIMRYWQLEILVRIDFMTFFVELNQLIDVRIKIEMQCMILYFRWWLAICARSRALFRWHACEVKR